MVYSAQNMTQNHFFFETQGVTILQQESVHM